MDFMKVSGDVRSIKKGDKFENGDGRISTS